MFKGEMNMGVPEKQKPIYDDRVNYILRSLTAGISREELAMEFNHNDYKTLDMYMRRRNFKWDRDKQNYRPIETRLEKGNQIGEEVHVGKVARVIEAFKEKTDPKEIAQEYGFKDHRELAKYMANKGYEWCANQTNYVRKVGVQQEREHSNSANSKVSHEEGLQQSNKELVNNEELLSIIKKLSTILNIDENPIVDRVPRYLVKGIAKNKTVPISHLLHQLIENFSEENHITHREIFEVALVDFFTKYGYKYEVEILFKNA